MNRKRPKKVILLSYILSFVLVGSVLLFATVPGYADITVKPMNVYFEPSPGETATRTITVENGRSDPTEVTVRLIDWFRTPDGGLQFFPPGNRERSCADWIVYSPNTLKVPPGESRRIIVEMSVPEDVKGDYWATFLVQESSEGGGEEQVATRISVNYVAKIFYKNPITSEKTAKISNIKVVEKDPLSFEVKLKNTSPSYLRVSGDLEVRDLEGETVRSIEIEEFGLLPEGERILSLSSSTNSPLDAGTYYAIVVMDFGAEHLIQGGLPIEISQTGEGSEN